VNQAMNNAVQRIWICFCCIDDWNVDDNRFKKSCRKVITGFLPNRKHPRMDCDVDEQICVQLNEVIPGFPEQESAQSKVRTDRVLGQLFVIGFLLSHEYFQHKLFVQRNTNL
jgi:hypothetical protein